VAAQAAHRRARRPVARKLRGDARSLRLPRVSPDAAARAGAPPALPAAVRAALHARDLHAHPLRRGRRAGAAPDTGAEGHRGGGRGPRVRGPALAPPRWGGREVTNYAPRRSDLYELPQARPAPRAPGAPLPAGGARRAPVHRHPPGLRAVVQAPPPRAGQDQTGLYGERPL